MVDVLLRGRCSSGGLVPPGIDPAAGGAALAEDVVDLLARLAQAEPAIAATAADRPLAEGSPGRACRSTRCARADRAAGPGRGRRDGFDQAAVLAADAARRAGHDPGQAAAAADHQAGRGGARPGRRRAARRGRPPARAGLAGRRRPGHRDPPTLRDAAPQPGDVAVDRRPGAACAARPTWRRLDPALEGWDTTRASCWPAAGPAGVARPRPADAGRPAPAGYRRSASPGSSSSPSSVPSSVPPRLSSSEMSQSSWARANASGSAKSSSVGQQVGVAPQGVAAGDAAVLGERRPQRAPPRAAGAGAAPGRPARRTSARPDRRPPGGAGTPRRARPPSGSRSPAALSTTWPTQPSTSASAVSSRASAAFCCGVSSGREDALERHRLHRLRVGRVDAAHRLLDRLPVDRDAVRVRLHRVEHVRRAATGRARTAAGGRPRAGPRTAGPGPRAAPGPRRRP